MAAGEAGPGAIAMVEEVAAASATAAAEAAEPTAWPPLKHR
jgi:hypothetical protein